MSRRDEPEVDYRFTYANERTFLALGAVITVAQRQWAQNARAMPSRGPLPATRMVPVVTVGVVVLAVVVGVLSALA